MHIIDQAHIKQDTEERDFFSVFYYDGYSVSKDNQEIHLQQKVCNAVLLSWLAQASFLLIDP